MEEFVYREAQHKTVDLSKMNPAEYNPRFDLKLWGMDYDGLKKTIIRNGLLECRVYYH